MWGRAAITGGVMLAMALAGCGGSDSGSAAEAAAVRAKSDTIFAETERAYASVKACVKRYRIAGGLKEAERCVRRSNVILMRTLEELAVLHDRPEILETVEALAGRIDRGEPLERAAIERP